MRSVCDYAVAYDISSKKERDLVDKILKGFGFRAQESVFECRLNKTGLKEMIQRLEKLGLKSGFVKIYKIEHSSKPKIVGVKTTKDFDEGDAFII
jgi:CRISPR-associated endonuclease Cas2